MADEAVNDVNAAETETASVPSDTNETTQESSESPDQTEEQSTEETKSVPYSRFKEINDQAKQREQEVAQLRAEMEQLKTQSQANPEQKTDPQIEQVKQQLKQLGFVTREEQDAELRRREQDAQLATELSRLGNLYDGKDGRPKFDKQKVVDYALKNNIGNVETAYKALHEKQLLDWHIKNATSKTAGVKTEASDGSGSSQVGISNSDLKSEIGKGNKDALHTLLKRQFSFK
jgi:regulator of replication initiation timing